MAKLKLGPIEDDKPVKMTIELPAALHRDLVAYAQALARETAGEALEPAKLIAPMLARFMATGRLRRHGAWVNRRRSARGSAPPNSEETRQRRVFVVRSPMGGIGEPSWLRDEDFEGSAADRAKSLKAAFERCCREGGLGVSTPT
jgi:hypothetical protein